MSIIVVQPSDLNGLFVRAQADASRSTRYVSAGAVDPTNEQRVILFDDVEAIGSVNVGTTVSSATDAETREFVTAELSRADAAGSRHTVLGAAFFPAAVMFSAAFLVILFASGHTGAAFLTDLNVLSQFGTPVLCAITAGAGFMFIDVRARSTAATARTATETMWAERCAAHTEYLKGRS